MHLFSYGFKVITFSAGLRLDIYIFYYLQFKIRFVVFQMMGDETFSQLAVNNSSDTLSQGYPGYYSPANRHHNSHQFHQQMGGGGGTYQSFGGGGGREEHTPDLLSAGELQQSITFHSPLWLDLYLDVKKKLLFFLKT